MLPAGSTVFPFIIIGRAAIGLQAKSMGAEPARMLSDGANEYRTRF